MQLKANRRKKKKKKKKRSPPLRLTLTRIRDATAEEEKQGGGGGGRVPVATVEQLDSSPPRPPSVSGPNCRPKRENTKGGVPRRRRGGRNGKAHRAKKEAGERHLKSFVLRDVMPLVSAGWKGPAEFRRERPVENSRGTTWLVHLTCSP